MGSRCNMHGCDKYKKNVSKCGLNGTRANQSNTLFQELGVGCMFCYVLSNYSAVCPNIQDRMDPMNDMGIA